MNTKEDLLTIMNKNYSSMSRGQKQIAAYLMEHYEKAAFLTAAEISRKAGVSESTVIRFAAALGYGGFPELHKALGQLVKKRLSQVQKLEFSKKNATRNELIKAVLQSDLVKLEDTFHNLDLAAMDIAVANILNAKTVYIIGIRNCTALAEYLYFHLNLVCPQVVLLKSTSSSEIFEQMMRIGETDAMIGISFPRYSLRTLKAMEFANSRNARLIAITDSVYSPLHLYSACSLLARSDLSSVMDSLTAPLSLMNALVMALYMEREEEVLANMELVETLWEDYQIYSKDEINFFDPQKGTNLNE
ncbi:MAG: MurR/RpiR family transcriptional regulator [Lachnospiraceae bacterium]|nr:MurR/RpiR family transcriptional regulator [Lachnospiraceae bacterium]